jgi:hemoglobin
MTAPQGGTVESMYDRIGGGPAIGSVVEQLYDWILADKQLQPYFDGVEIPRVKRHMAALLSDVLGGPVPYSGPDLREAHSELGVTSEDYDRVVDLAAAALLLAHVPRDVVAAVEGVLEQTKSQIATDPAPEVPTDQTSGAGGLGDG